MSKPNVPASPPQPTTTEEAPCRVGSLVYISGEVNYALRAVSGDPAVLGWSTADFNQPVSQDMSLQTGPMASARVRIGPNAIQMSGDTLIDVLNLSDQIIEISVRVGRIHLQLSRLSQIESVEIPYGSVWLLQTGAYEIETGTADQPARVVVFDGRARFIGGKVDLPIDGGEEARVTGPHPLGVSTGPASPTATSGASNHGETVRRYREAAVEAMLQHSTIWAGSTRIVKAYPRTIGRRCGGIARPLIRAKPQPKTVSGRCTKTARASSKIMARR